MVLNLTWNRIECICTHQIKAHGRSVSATDLGSSNSSSSQSGQEEVSSESDGSTADADGAGAGRPASHAGHRSPPKLPAWDPATVPKKRGSWGLPAAALSSATSVQVTPATLPPPAAGSAAAAATGSSGHGDQHKGHGGSSNSASATLAPIPLLTVVVQQNEKAKSDHHHASRKPASVTDLDGNSRPPSSTSVMLLNLGPLGSSASGAPYTSNTSSAAAHSAATVNSPRSPGANVAQLQPLVTPRGTPVTAAAAAAASLPRPALLPRQVALLTKCLDDVCPRKYCRRLQLHLDTT